MPEARIVEFMLFGIQGGRRWEIRFNLTCAANVRLTSEADRFDIVATDASREPVGVRLTRVADRSDGTTYVEASGHRGRALLSSPAC